MSSTIDNETGVEIPEETKTGIVEMNAVAAGIGELQGKFAHVPDCSTVAGYELAKSERKEIAKVRIKIEKAHKGAKAFYLEGGRNVDKMKNDILAAVTPLEQVRKDAIKAVDDEWARVVGEAAEKERLRVEAIETALGEIGNQLYSVTLETITASLVMLEETNYQWFQEYEEPARAKVAEVVSQLNERLPELQAQADEAKRLAEQREEQERQAAELQERQGAIAEQTRQLEERQKKADEKETARLAAIQKEEDDQKAADDLAEENRLITINNRINLIKTAHEHLFLVDQADDELDELYAIETASFDEFEDEVIKLIADAKVAVESRRAEIVDEHVAEKKRISDEAVAKEQARQQAEADKLAEEQAERERVAARAPDSDKLIDYCQKIVAVKVPEMETDEGKKQLNVILDLVLQIEPISYSLVEEEAVA